MREKNYGIDALRVLAMFMVVIVHIMNLGGVLNSTYRFTSQYESGWLLHSAAFCAVDVFALVSGYVWVNGKYRYRNIVELWLQVVFYTISITALFHVLSPGSVSAMDWLKAAFPLMFGQYWYFSSYFAMYLFIPLLNIVLEKMEKNQLFCFIGIVLLWFSCIQTLFYSDVFGTMDGYSAIWLMILYLVGGCIRKYSTRKRRESRSYFAGYLLLVALTWLSKLIIELLTRAVLEEPRAGNYLISYKSPTILLAAICLFLTFERMDVPLSIKKGTQVLAPLTFGVFLIHANPLVSIYIMNNRFSSYASFPWPIEIFAVLGTAAMINLICYGMEYMRVLLFRKLKIRKNLDMLESSTKKMLSTFCMTVSKKQPDQ